MTHNKLNIVYISSCLPRQCGIATFTDDLANAVAEKTQRPYRLVALNNISQGYSYPGQVNFEIQQNRLSDYKRAAEYLNNSNAQVICLQHEFGLYGGEAGEYIAYLIGNLDKPILTTLHTVLKDPLPEYRKAFIDVCRYSDKIVVMSQVGLEILRNTYKIPEEKISLIYHGVPEVPFVDPSFYKGRFFEEDRLIILTFGLLSPNKGIEVMLEALPPVVEKHPEVLYVVLGATHPEIRRREGEKYRISLERQARDLGIEDNVLFINQFVEKEELYEYIMASDIYVTPYYFEEQVVSGTLSYALGMGKAIVSTPYWYAKELLAEERGIIVPVNDPPAFSRAILELIQDSSKFNRIRKNAYQFSRQMVWDKVAEAYVDEFEKVIASRAVGNLREERKAPTFVRATLPDIKLDHLYFLSDDAGILQHAPYGVPDFAYGYSADDVGRALAALCKLYRLEPQQELEKTISSYISFIRYAQTETGHFHNFMSFDRQFLDEQGTEDTLGRVIWGLGNVIRAAPTEGLGAICQNMAEKSYPLLQKLTHPRAKAYAICGLYAILKRFSGARHPRQILTQLADGLVELYHERRSDNWEWVDDAVTYGNAKVCEALLRAYEVTGIEEYKEVGLKTLEFLLEIQWNGKYFDIIGNDGWLTRGGDRAVFGQQSIDAAYLVEACRKAYEVTGNDWYIAMAHNAFEWFLGRNRHEKPVYDFSTGAVADGLDPQGVSFNQGAEAVVCFLLALITLFRLSLEGSKARTDTD